MKIMKTIGTFSLLAWLLMATSSLSQSDETSVVVDTAGNPLQRGQEYYIKPAITDSGGRFTLIDRNASCPFYVGQENTDLGAGFPVIFSPFAGEDNTVKLHRDFTVAFSALTICVQSTEWHLGEREEESGRRLIVASGTDQKYTKYFRIVETEFDGIYNIQWCPTEVCPFCRFDCGKVGGLRENGKILMALDGSVLPLVFEKA